MVICREIFLTVLKLAVASGPNRMGLMCQWYSCTTGAKGCESAVKHSAERPKPVGVGPQYKEDT